MRYQGVDWRKKANWKCGDNANPFNLAHDDDHGLNPMELMFVKYKFWHAATNNPSMQAARLQSVWLDAYREVRHAHSFPYTPRSSINVAFLRYLTGSSFHLCVLQC